MQKLFDTSTSFGPAHTAMTVLYNMRDLLNSPTIPNKSKLAALLVTAINDVVEYDKYRKLPSSEQKTIEANIAANLVNLSKPSANDSNTSEADHFSLELFYNDVQLENCIRAAVLAQHENIMKPRENKSLSYPCNL